MRAFFIRNNFFKGGIAGNIITLLFMFGLVPLAVFTMIFFTFYFEGRKQDIAGIQREITTRISSNISAHFENTMSQIQLFAHLLDLGNRDKLEIMTLAYDFLDRTPEYEIITVTDIQGTEICKVSRHYTFRSSELGDLSSDPSFRAAMSGRPHVSRIRLSGFSQFPQVHITVPIVTLEDRITGVLDVCVNVAMMWELISASQVGEKRYAYIVDDMGTLIAYQDIASVLQKKDLLHIQGVRSFLDGQIGVSEYSGLANVQVIGANALIPLTRWGVIVEIPLSDAYAHLHMLSAIFMGIFLITLAAAVCLGLRFSFRKIVRPIRHLQEEAEVIAKGDFNRKIEIHRSDKLGQLSGTFNKMVRELRRTTVSRDSLLQEVSERKRTEKALRESEERFRDILHSMAGWVWEVDKRGKFIYASERVRDILGYAAQEVIGKTAFDLMPKDESERISETIREHFAKRMPIADLKNWNLAKTGERRCILTNGVPIFDEKGDFHGYRGVDKDVTAQFHAETALRESERKHQVVLEAIPDPVAVYDLDGNMTYLNPAFTRVFGWTLEEAIRQPIHFIPLEHLPETRDITKRIHQGETVSGIETQRLSRTRERIEVSISGAGFFSKHDKLLGSVITFQDIRERRRAKEKITFIAYHDGLTGLPNRKSFYVQLRNWGSHRHGQVSDDRGAENRRWALLFLDLDKFKYVNETLGHDVGDRLLKKIATRIQNSLRKTDHVFRLGGDEFTIILNHLSKNTDVVMVAQKIREEIARPCRIMGHEIYMTASIGISICPDDSEDMAELVKNADMAMYAAKDEKEGYRFFTEEMNLKAQERMKLEGDLRQALRHKQFVLHYQPMINGAGRITGMEALLRWQHPEMGMISPGQFIPLAEETGIIVPIGEWTLHSACRQVKKWQDMGYGRLYVAVNLSTRQFREPDMVETVEKALETTGLPPDSLKLEVTESGIMENPEQAIAKMKILRKKGIRFSIDDFGTGYSSLSYLKQFPIDTLKIDRSFVMDAITNRDDQEIIKAIISMARSLNLDTVAEGVETRDQQEFLHEQGCQIMQGFYLGRPMSHEDFEEILRTQTSSP